MQLDLQLALSILVAHWVADFLMQTHVMATRKGESLRALTIHIITYTIGIFITMGVLSGFLNIWPILIWALVNGGMHWVVDFFTSKMNKTLLKSYGQGAFFNGIGFDQLLHYFCLLISAAHLLTF